MIIYKLYIIIIKKILYLIINSKRMESDDYLKDLARIQREREDLKLEGKTDNYTLQNGVTRRDIYLSIQQKNQDKQLSFRVRLLYIYLINI